MNRKQTIEWLKIKRLERAWLSNEHYFWYWVESPYKRIKQGKFHN